MHAPPEALRQRGGQADGLEDLVHARRVGRGVEGGGDRVPQVVPYLTIVRRRTRPLAPAVSRTT